MVGGEFLGQLVFLFFASKIHMTAAPHQFKLAVGERLYSRLTQCQIRQRRSAQRRVRIRERRHRSRLRFFGGTTQQHDAKRIRSRGWSGLFVSGHRLRDLVGGRLINGQQHRQRDSLLPLVLRRRESFQGFDAQPDRLQRCLRTINLIEAHSVVVQQA